ncbi:MAG: DNA gyrase C-terminal beta-propeller domain-containing protein, partial [Oscillospiraceae bacterium]
EYTLQHRGGLGNRNYKVTKNGAVAGIKSVYEGDDAIIISDDGVIIRIPVGEINVQSRYGGGVRVMRLAEDSRIVTLACAPREEEAGSALLTEGDPAEAEETEDGSAPQAPGRDTDEDDAEEIGEEIAEEIAEDGDTEQ